MPIVQPTTDDPVVARLAQRLRESRALWHQRGYEDARAWADSDATPDELRRLGTNTTPTDAQERRFPESFGYEDAIDRWARHDAQTPTERSDASAPISRGTPQPPLDRGAYVAGWFAAVRDLWTAVSAIVGPYETLDETRQSAPGATNGTGRHSSNNSNGGRDFTKFDVGLGTRLHRALNKRRAMLAVVRHLCTTHGVTPDTIVAALPSERRGARTFFSLPGRITEGGAFVRAAQRAAAGQARPFEAGRWFCASDQLIHAEGQTYALTNQWGTNTAVALADLAAAFPHAGISVTPRPQ